MRLKTKSSQIHQTVVQMKPLLSISLAISPVLSASSAVAGFCRCWCLDEPSLLFDHFLASTPPPLAHTYTHTKRQIQTHKLSKRDQFKSNHHGAPWYIRLCNPSHIVSNIASKGILVALELL